MYYLKSVIRAFLSSLINICNGKSIIEDIVNEKILISAKCELRIRRFEVSYQLCWLPAWLCKYRALMMTFFNF